MEASVAGVMEIQPDPHVIVLFGATGDLARRKILPGLFHLFTAHLMPHDFRIVGSSPESFAMSTDEFRRHAQDAIGEFGTGDAKGPEWEEFARRLTFAVANPDGSGTLAAAVAEAEGGCGASLRVFHLAVPPDAVLPMVKMLGDLGLNERARLICEKPFGTDLASALALDAEISAHFDESQVFRIDHFLGKESVDNILALRFANGLFEPIWNRHHVSYVQIDVPETISIEGRSRFFEDTGTFRDMVVTHLFQVLGFIAMEEPSNLRAGPLRNEVVKVFESMRPIDPANVVRGQYIGYRDEPGVAPDSETETFAALKVEIDNSRWHGVPFHLRTGKCLAESRQVVTIGFHEPPAHLFRVTNDRGHRRGNMIVIDFADPGSIDLRFLAKVPGPYMHLGPSEMRFTYEDSFLAANHLEPYEHLVLSVMYGDQTLFTRSDGITRIWELAAPVLDNCPPVELYEPGSWGPASIRRLASPHRWFLPAPRIPHRHTARGGDFPTDAGRG